MEEIKVGEYVRTKDGKIGKIYNYSCGTYKTKMFGASSGEIAKHNQNIIDLIEVGDYVSSKDGIEGKVDFVMLPLKIFVNGEEVLNDEIKSIVTHEQFAQIEYKVEE